jgi:transposase-like protein
MTKKPRKAFSKEEKKKAVDDYVSGKRSAQQVADDLSVDVHYIYRWKIQFDEESKGLRIEELEKQGISREAAKKISQMEDEISVYQKKVAEQSVIIDLLKKIQNSTNLAPESELSGLIATTKKLDRKKGRVE